MRTMNGIRYATGGLLVLAAAGCGRTPPTRTSLPTEAPRRVTSVAVRPSGPHGETVPATVRARERATLTARVSGSVMTLPFREGDAVAAGAVVARIEDRALRAALAAARRTGIPPRRTGRARRSSCPWA